MNQAFCVSQHIEAQSKSARKNFLRDKFNQKLSQSTPSRRGIEVFFTTKSIKINSRTRRSLKGKNVTIRRSFQVGKAHSVIVSSQAELDSLLNDPDIKSIGFDVPVSANLDRSVPEIGTHFLSVFGGDGTGISVAVLDTGIESNHPNLASSLVHEECFLSIEGAPNGTGLCPNASNRQSGIGAAEDNIGHGTHVAGIIASDGVVGSVGIAPASSIVSYKVLEGDPTIGGVGLMSDVLAALEHIAANPSLGIDVINMSLSSFDVFTENDCHLSNPIFEAMFNVIQTLKSNGVIVLGSAGNDGVAGAGAPACFSNVVSVGATNLGNELSLASYSNRGLLVDLVAPGGPIYSSDLDGQAASKQGTSMAVAHVTGLVALLKQRGTLTNAQSALDYFAASPLLISDPSSNAQIPKIIVYDTDADGDTIADYIEEERCTSFLDIDTDDDGIADHHEDSNLNGVLEFAETDPCSADTDSDLIADGIEIGVQQLIEDPDGTGPLLATNPASFFVDSDLTTTTDPLDKDSDEDGLRDGDEDINANGFVDIGETDPNDPDTDDDGLLDGIETSTGLIWGAQPPLSGTDSAVDVEDQDTSSVTNPLVPDTDSDGISDGEEDINANGRVDYGERDPGTLFDNGFPQHQDVPLSRFGLSGGKPSTLEVTGDGKVDLVGTLGNQLYTFANNGNGFDLVEEYVSLSFPGSFTVVGDVTADNIKDVIVSHENDHQLSFIANSSNGLDSNASSLSLGIRPSFVTIADINGDEIKDIVVGAVNSSNVEIYLSSGNGQFEPPVTVDIGSNAVFVTALDFDRDGIAELLVSDSNNNLFIYRDFSLVMSEQPETLVLPTFPDWLHIIDVAGDPRPYLIFGRYSSGSVYLLAQTDDTSWGTASPLASLDSIPQHSLVSDINQDGLDDLLLATRYANLQIFLGNASGSLNPPYELVGPVDADKIFVEPFLGTNYLDLGISGRNGFYVLEALGPGIFNVENTVVQEDFFRYKDIKIADINQDGEIDITASASDSTGHFVRTLFGTGRGTFTNIIDSQILNTGLSITNWRELALGELNGDQHLDVIIDSYSGSGNDNALAIAYGDGAGNFSFLSPQVKPHPHGHILVAQIDNDDSFDILLSPDNGAYHSYDAVPYLYLNSGNGIFAVPTTFPELNVTGGAAAFDLNSDDIVDIAFPVANGGYQIMLGSGAGSFSSGDAGILTTAKPRQVLLEDLIGDANKDLVVALDWNGVQIIPGAGNGAFGEPVNYVVGINAKEIDLVDMNTDGLLDIVAADKQGSVSVLIQNNDMTFQSPYITEIITGSIETEYGDVNDDTYPDIISIPQTSGSISVVLNRFSLDPDGDGIDTPLEVYGCTSPKDIDSDDDGLSDSEELQIGTDPCNWDSDGDGLSDGMELGRSVGIPDPDQLGPFLGTDLSVFTYDEDPSTRTNPLVGDNDGDGYWDGIEDVNRNGLVDEGESDPNDINSVPTPRLHKVPFTSITMQLLLIYLIIGIGYCQHRKRRIFSLL